MVVHLFRNDNSSTNKNWVTSLDMAHVQVTYYYHPYVQKANSSKKSLTAYSLEICPLSFPKSNEEFSHHKYFIFRANVCRRKNKIRFQKSQSIFLDIFFTSHGYQELMTVPHIRFNWSTHAPLSLWWRRLMKINLLKHCGRRRESPTPRLPGKYLCINRPQWWMGEGWLIG